MKTVVIFLLTMFSAFMVNAQVEIGGVKVPGSMKVAESNLVLNGGGVREKFFLDMYVGVLYLQQNSSDADKIINADEPMAIRLHIVSSLISSEKMVSAVDEGFEKSTDGNTAPLADKIRQFKDVFSEEIKKGDIYSFIYSPGVGVKITRNGKHSTTISGYEFKKALFGIWLCDEPADDDLKEGMLGE